MRRPLPTAFLAILVLATVASISPAVAARYCLRSPAWGHPAIVSSRRYSSAGRPLRVPMPLAGSIRATRSHAIGGP